MLAKNAFVFPFSILPLSLNVDVSDKPLLPTAYAIEIYYLINYRIEKLQYNNAFESLVIRRGTLLMETGLFHDFFGNFSVRSVKYYFRAEGSTPDEIQPKQGEIETNNKTNIQDGGQTEGPEWG